MGVGEESTATPTAGLSAWPPGGPAAGPVPAAAARSGDGDGQGSPGSGASQPQDGPSTPGPLLAVGESADQTGHRPTAGAHCFAAIPRVF